jgi:hypothetical protein
MYVQTLGFWNATWCPNVEAIGEKVSEIVWVCTASQWYIDSIHVYQHARIWMQGCVKIAKQSVSKFRWCTGLKERSWRIHRFPARCRCHTYI